MLVEESILNTHDILNKYIPSRYECISEMYIPVNNEYTQGMYSIKT